MTGPTETAPSRLIRWARLADAVFFSFFNGGFAPSSRDRRADGVIDADSDVFFASVMTPPMAGEVVFTSDPNVRYDRLSARWFVSIIDVVLDATTGAITRPNRVLFALSNTSTITGATVWTFYQFQGDATLFTDYTSLGIDASALYIGGDMFTIAGAFNSTKGFVIPKAPLLTASPATVWAFSGLVATPTGAGPFASTRLDNYDPRTPVLRTRLFYRGDNATSTP